MLPALPRNVDQQSLLRAGNRVGDGQFQRSQHFNALIKRGSKVLFVGEHAWYDIQYLVDVSAGSVRQGEVGDGGRVETAGQYSESRRSSTRAAIELHLPTV